MGTVAGLFETRQEAENAIEQLRNAGVDHKDIGIALKGSGETREAAKSSGVETVASSAGGALAGVLNAIGAEGIVGGLSGVLTKAGIPREEAEVYQNGVKQGGVLVTADVPEEQESIARGLMQQCGCMDPTQARSLLESDPNYQFGQHPGAGTMAATQSAVTGNQPYAYESPGSTENVVPGSSGQGYSSTMPGEGPNTGTTRNASPEYATEIDQEFISSSSISGESVLSEEDLEPRPESGSWSADPYNTSTGSRGNAAEGFSSGEDTNIRQGSSAIHPESTYPTEEETGFSTESHLPEEKRRHDRDQGLNASGSNDPMI